MAAMVVKTRYQQPRQNENIAAYIIRLPIIFFISFSFAGSYPICGLLLKQNRL